MRMKENINKSGGHAYGSRRKMCPQKLRKHYTNLSAKMDTAAIAQLGERQTEDLKVPGSIPGLGIAFVTGFGGNAIKACGL